MGWEGVQGRMLTYCAICWLSKSVSNEITVMGSEGGCMHALCLFFI